jgi:nucleolar protein 56
VGIYLVLKVMGSLLNSSFWISGLMTDELRSFLELNLPKVKEVKKPKFRLGIADTKIGSHIHEVTKLPCESGEFILELLRGVRLHFDRFLKDLKVCISL